ncbi:LysR family transcriptional regulator [Sphingomonas sediminicola]|uniref:LysR family transcriptional regulator n=1 Tax=Sphingomonas sediminicola TaxID=386874 RepID=UPI003CF81AD6
MFSWDDIGVFLALYRERTTGRAANARGVSQPTIVRRIAALENDLGLALFERSPTGLMPTDAAHGLYASAQRIERSVCEFTAEVDGLTGAEVNLIRLTFLDHFEQLLIPVLRDFRSRWPRVQTQLLASDHIYDLARGEADIGVRGRDRPTSDELIVRQLPPSGWTIYASAHSSAEERPRAPADVAGHPIALVGGVPATLPVYLWLEEFASSGPPPARCNNYRAIKSLVASGSVLSALPCTIGDGDSDLVRCFPPLEEWDVPIYLIGRRAILRRPPARDLFDSIAAHFDRHPELLMGVR